MEKIQSYKDLIAWQKAMDLVCDIYAVTELFPPAERYGLISQLRRAAVSIPSNIAEGSRCGSRKNFRNFILIAYASGAELETQIEIAKRLPFGRQLNFSTVDGLLDAVMRMLNRIADELNH